MVTTDGLENVLVDTTAATQDGDRMSDLGASVGITDRLDNVMTNVKGSTVDGNERNDFGIKFSFDE